MFIGISGLIGVGKSTLTKDLAAELDRRSAERVAQASTFMTFQDVPSSGVTLSVHPNDPDSIPE